MLMRMELKGKRIAGVCAHGGVEVFKKRARRLHYVGGTLLPACSSFRGSESLPYAYASIEEQSMGLTHSAGVHSVFGSHTPMLP